MEKTFETEVLTRLTVIETKLDDYKSIKDKAECAYTLSISNKKEIEEIQDNNKWLFRTSIGAIITSAIALVFLLINSGMGVH